jgi:hypothetical protein
MIVIATPTRDSVIAGFAYDLVRLIQFDCANEIIFSVTQGTNICNNRSLLAQTALGYGASHILFIDSDMRFPPDALKRLLACVHDCKVSIIGANCRQRTQKEYTARKGSEFISSKGRTGIEEVETLGFGVTLIQRDVFAALKKPWFHTPWDGTKQVTEDVYFCTMAREAGFKVHIDHDLSQLVRHAGTVEFGTEDF